MQWKVYKMLSLLLHDAENYLDLTLYNSNLRQQRVK